MSPGYVAVLRDVAQRNLPFHPLTDAELVTILTEFPDVVGEALGDESELFIETLRDGDDLGVLVKGLLRRRCESYIATDVSLMKDTLEDEFRVDNEFAREAV